MASLSILVSPLIVPHVYALQLSGENWSSNKYYQGDGGTMTMTVYNNIPLFQWYVKTVELQFDWQVQSHVSYQTAVGQNIASGQSGTFTISFDIPQSAHVGTHSYTIYYVGMIGDMHSIATGSFYVHDMYEKQYDGMLSSIQSQMNSLPNYNSPNARSDLNQARSDFVQATTLASQNQFQSAASKLNEAQDMLNQASTEEQSYNANNANNYNSGGGSSNNNYYSNSGNSYSSFNPTLLFIIVIPIAIVIGGIVLWRMKKGHTTSKPKKSQNKVSTSMTETKRNDATSSTSDKESKTLNVKSEVAVIDIPKIEIKPKEDKTKPPMEIKSKKTQKEIEQDQKALWILKERLATGTIDKSEYDKLKKEFE